MNQRAGRRAGSPDTRSEILAAARAVFSEHGYDRATIRAIATRAGVDPALVHHYFGTKDELFAASINVPFPPGQALASILTDGVAADSGRRLATLFFSIWEQEEARTSLLGILRSALGGEDQAVEAFRQFIARELQGRIAPMMPHQDASLRALLMASQLVGVAVTRYVVKLEPIASASLNEIVDLVAPRLQSYLDP